MFQYFKSNVISNLKDSESFMGRVWGMGVHPGMKKRDSERKIVMANNRWGVRESI